MKRYLLVYNRPVRQYTDYDGPYTLDELSSEWEKLEKDGVEVFGSIEIMDHRNIERTVKPERTTKKKDSSVG